MFANHQPTIAAHTMRNAYNLALVQQFVVCTIQVPLTRVADDLATCIDAARARRDDDGIRGILYAWKYQAFASAWSEREERYWHACDILASDATERERADALVNYFASLPGFGPVKAGFVCQLAFGLSACLDTNNAKRLGVNVNYFHAHKFKTAKPHTKRRKVARYNDTVEALGGTAHLWDTWCAYVAERDKKHSAFEVSAMHVDALAPHFK